VYLVAAVLPTPQAARAAAEERAAADQSHAQANEAADDMAALLEAAQSRAREAHDRLA
jgi:hypothetical protein